MLGQLHLVLDRDEYLQALRRRIIAPTTELAKPWLYSLGGKQLSGRTPLQHLAAVVADVVPRHAAAIATAHHRLARAALAGSLNDEQLQILHSFAGGCLARLALMRQQLLSL